MKAEDIEYAVANYYGWRQNIIVPNVSWGMPGLRYEVDMFILRPSGYAVEVEIKISLSDIKADLKKAHQHDSNYFRELYFAMPQELIEKAIEFIPERAGIFYPKTEKVVYGKMNDLHTVVEARAEIFRKAEINKSAEKLSDNNIEILTKLGCMRIWRLKKRLLNIEKDKK